MSMWIHINSWNQDIVPAYFQNYAFFYSSDCNKLQKAKKLLIQETSSPMGICCRIWVRPLLILQQFVNSSQKVYLWNETSVINTVFTSLSKTQSGSTLGCIFMLCQSIQYTQRNQLIAVDLNESDVNIYCNKCVCLSTVDIVSHMCPGIVYIKTQFSMCSPLANID